MFRSRTKHRVSKPTFTGIAPRKGKKRMDSREIGPAQRSTSKRIKRLRKSGYRKGSSQPVNHMNEKQWSKMQSKIESGNYQIKSVIEPPKWVGEAPREWLMLRRR